LNAGRSLSCGCRRTESLSTHRMSKCREYHVWTSMTQRCNNKKSQVYKNYGGRGITVSKEWLSFETFIEDMGVSPSADLTLERVDNNAGYSKANCIWADRSAQIVNQRMRVDNKTGRKGVSIDSCDNRYRATITRNHKRVELGKFSDLEEAIAARVKAEEIFNQTGAI